MTRENTLESYRYSTMDKKNTLMESFKKNFMIAGILYAASQDAMNGNGRAAAEMMKTYRQMTA